MIYDDDVIQMYLIKLLKFNLKNAHKNELDKFVFFAVYGPWVAIKNRMFYILY